MTTKLVTKLAKRTADVQALNDKITALQNQTGIPPALQAEIDALALQGQAVADKAAALDALTPPVV